jgi:hypothetical protein
MIAHSAMVAAPGAPARRDVLSLGRRRPRSRPASAGRSGR